MNRQGSAKIADEMIRSEMLRVGITVPLQDLEINPYEEEDSDHWSAEPGAQVLNKRALRVIQEARTAFVAWAKAKDDLERNLANGSSLIERAASLLREAAVLAANKPEEA